MSILQKFLARASGNYLIQRILEKTILFSHDLMGIGPGSVVSLSGERAIFQALRQRFNPPYCIFDVGANQGQFLQLILNNIAVDDYAIHCFEPGRETFKILTESCKVDSRIKLNNVGLSKEKGAATLHYDNVGSGLASLTKRRLDHFQIDFSQTETIELNTIDDYCVENAIACIHLLKLDIEGHELDALAGAKQMFASQSIKMVTFEFGGCNIDTRTYFQDFWYFFKTLHFSIFRITPSGYLFPINSYNEIYEQFRTTNFIAVANQ